MAANYSDVLGQLQEAGLEVDSLDVCGRLVRCRCKDDKEKRGWYVLHELVSIGGDTLIVGSYGIWHGANNNAKKVTIGKDSLSREQQEGMRRRITEDRRRAEAARKAEAERAAKVAQKAWAACSPDGDAEYLRRKCVMAHGVRFSPSGAVVVPVLDTAAKIHGLQVIRTAAESRAKKRPQKEFWPQGMVKKGHFYLVGIPTNIVLIAEGYATGASLHEATGLPIAIAFDAGNLAPVASALRARYKTVRILICADDDAFTDGNPGVTLASTAAIEVGGSFVRPQFADEGARRAKFEANGNKLTDFNDLHQIEGLPVVRQQIEARISELGWRLGSAASRNNDKGKGGAAALAPVDSVEELLDRYALVYGHRGMVFDRQEHVLIQLSDMRDVCMKRDLHRAWAEHPERAIVRVREVGFDPGGDDPLITCNLWAGWPTEPKPGRCEKLLELLRHMCSGDHNQEQLYQWVLRWLAYPIQNPGAKMKTTLVIHGPQGTGKNLFFEAVMSIYGPYGRVIDQAAVEDKFNDWATRKLFLIADEVLARSDVYHVKNRLKSFITGDWIRINPKNMAAYDEKNHVNIVFLSNESMPVVVEEDDRRHTVIWTPSKLPPEFYALVKKELDDGGVEALHHHFLHLDMGDFGPATKPPVTDAKDELIAMSRDSTSAFYFDLIDEAIPGINPGPMLSQDLYDLYKAWCHQTGARAAPMKKLLNAWDRKHKVGTARKRYMDGNDLSGLRTVVMLYTHRRDESVSEPVWLGQQIAASKAALAEFKGSAWGK